MVVHVPFDIMFMHPSMLGSELQDGIGTVIEVIRVLGQKKRQDV